MKRDKLSRKLREKRALLLSLKEEGDRLEIEKESYQRQKLRLENIGQFERDRAEVEERMARSRKEIGELRGRIRAQFKRCPVNLEEALVSSSHSVERELLVALKLSMALDSKLEGVWDKRGKTNDEKFSKRSLLDELEEETKKKGLSFKKKERDFEGEAKTLLA